MAVVIIMIIERVNKFIDEGREWFYKWFNVVTSHFLHCTLRIGSRGGMFRYRFPTCASWVHKKPLEYWVALVSHSWTMCRWISNPLRISIVIPRHSQSRVNRPLRFPIHWHVETSIWCSLMEPKRTIPREMVIEHFLKQVLQPTTRSCRDQRRTPGATFVKRLKIFSPSQ